MPRLSEGTADAYPDRNYKPGALVRVALVVFTLLMVKNILFTDYRNEEIAILKGSGLSQDAINTFVPPTASERRTENQKMADEYMQMKEDVALLKDEVKMLKEKLGIIDDDKKKNSSNTTTVATEQ